MFYSRAAEHLPAYASVKFWWKINKSTWQTKKVLCRTFDDNVLRMRLVTVKSIDSIRYQLDLITTVAIIFHVT